MEFVYVLLLILVAYLSGKHFEKNHYKSIKEREAKFSNQPAVTFNSVSDEDVVSCELAMGSVVISVDHFKRFIAGLNMLFGGELTSYSPLIDRGRREAILRMKAMAPHAHLYTNLRVETSTISNGKGKSVGTVEVLAYATAVTLKETSA